MSTKRYTEEFEVEAVNQVLDRGYRVAEVVERLGVNPRSPYQWINKRREAAAPRASQLPPLEEGRRQKAELKRVTEERDIPSAGHARGVAARHAGVAGAGAGADDKGMAPVARGVRAGSTAATVQRQPPCDSAVRAGAH